MDRLMRRRYLVGGAAFIAAIALVGGGLYIYYFSGLRTSPSQLALSATPAPTSSPVTQPAGLAGSWAVASGSLAGYRVKELFVGQTSQHEAVARTSTVSGGLTVTGDSTGYQVSALTITAKLSDLHSVDQVVGRDVTQRDSTVARQIEVQQYPTATFIAASVSVPGSVSSQQVDVTVSGKITIHGVTKDVTATARAQVIGGQIEIAGSLPIVMTDFQITPPQVPFVSVDSNVTIEFDVRLKKSA
jgi:polyisoprenoid-binding protein YceI